MNISNFDGLGIVPANILAPAPDVDVSRWAVVACDQFTSQPEYWREAEAFVGGAPSTLNMILPEVYLNSPDADERTERILSNMRESLSSTSPFSQPFFGFTLVERLFQPDESGAVRPPRIGLVAAVDLERYDFSPDSTSPIRATEGTIIERLPPRIAIRKEAAVELPHILLLLQDKERSVIEPIFARRDSLRKLYDSSLMLDGGAIRGWAVEEPLMIDAIAESLRRLPVVKGMRIAVGDGNHSLAAARAVWLEMRNNIPVEQRATHPLRFALAELCNAYDDGIAFEPIHRIVYGATLGEFLPAFGEWLRKRGGSMEVEHLSKDNTQTASLSRETIRQSVVLIDSESSSRITIINPPYQTAVGTIQSFLDYRSVLQEQTAIDIDYIHGDSVVRELASMQNRVGILLPVLDKSQLFPAIANDGALPRKTFSMGHAQEKRYYLEARALI